MTRWQHHSIGSQGLHMDCGSSSKCTGVDTMNSTKSVKRQMLRVSSNPRAKKKSRFLMLGTLASHSFQAVCRGESTVVAIE
ncbi:hypothetical protein B296_00000751 [Ensete ventricosum]|uniref:Uncharacterized protein n=1 Tax=Ensete ventricosum TaxID=4639 RepID=A0A427B5J1_ENSVE|nr:hypothetical protein B296_00000751 [Ensete ventricosum]